MTTTRELVSDRRDEYAFHDDIDYLAQTKRGLTRQTVEEISRFKGEPDWMLQFRLRAYEHFLKRPMPNWGGNLLDIDFDKIVYYRKPSAGEEKSWDDVPEKIKATFEKLGIPEAERKFLAGVGAQYDSEVVYHSVREELSKIGVVFMGTDQALKEYPEIFRKYFATVVPPEDNKFAALNSAVWSGGSFVYVPKGVEVPLPAAGLLPDQRREHRPVRTHPDRRRRGCPGPLHRGLHRPDLRDRLAPRRGRRGHRPARLEGPLHDDPELVERRLQPGHQAGPRPHELDRRVDRRQHRQPADDEVPGDLPPSARAPRPTSSRVAVAGKGQHQDTGAKAIHLAPNTRSRIVSKSVSKDGGRATYRGSLKVAPGATNVVASVRCDALMLDDISRSDTYPYIDIQEDDTTMTHEAVVGKISADQIFYLMSRGLTENEAQNLIVQGFLEVFTKELPMEYAIEFNRLVKLEMEGSLG